MSAETLLPDGLVSSANYTSPLLSDFDDNPDTTTDYGTYDGSGNTDVLLDFPTPTGNPTSGAGLQSFTVAVTKNATGGNTPAYSLELWENGLLVSVLATGNLADNTSKQTFSGTWNASSLGTANGSLVQIKMLQTSGGTGTPGNRRGVQVGGAKWDVEYTDPSSSNIPAINHQYRQIRG